MKVIKRIFIGVLVLFVLFFLGSFGLIAARTMDSKIQYQDVINKYAEEYKADPLMIAALIKVESDFDTNAKSHMGAKGLMQIVPETGQWIADHLDIDFEKDRLYDPDYNVRLGAYYYEYLYEYYGDRDLALAAYNGGMGNVDSWLEDETYSKDGRNLHYIPFDETRAYVDKVVKAYDQYEFFYKSGLPGELRTFELIKNNYKTLLSKLKDSF